VIASGDILEMLRKETKSLVSLAKLDPAQVSLYESGSEAAKKALNEVESVQLVVQDGVEAYLPLSGLIDPEKERKRLEKQNEKLSKEIQKLSGRLTSKGFTDKAPPEVVERARTDLAELEDQAAKVQASLAALR
jgi:valyl-tRNA synthetase